MDPFFEHLREAVVVKKFVDELERNPRRTLLALGAVLLLTGAGVAVAFRSPTKPAPPLSTLPATPPERTADGQYKTLPQPIEAEKQLTATLAGEATRRTSVTEELQRRKDDAPVSEREIRILNESGHVKY